MKSLFLLFSIAILVGLSSCSTPAEKESENKYPEPFESTWESLMAYEVPQWFDDAKFGIYTHWGPYSVPAWEN